MKSAFKASNILSGSQSLPARTVMTINSAINLSPSLNQLLHWLRRTLITGLLASLIWLPGMLLNPALAAPNVAEKMAMRVAESPAESDRLSALITCLPKELSQPNLKRALSEMGNDQIERALNLKANPKLSQAETDFASCLSRQ